MLKLKLIKVGNSVGAIFPKEALSLLRVDVGDQVFLTESPDGMRVTTNDPDFEAQMTVAEAIMRKDRAILRELSK